MLVKNPKLRIDSAAVVRLEVAEAASDLENGATDRDVGGAAVPRGRTQLPWIAAALAATAAVAMLAAWAPWRSVSTEPETRLDVVTPFGGEATDAAVLFEQPPRHARHLRQRAP